MILTGPLDIEAPGLSGTAAVSRRRIQSARRGLNIQKLALLTRFLGAKLGANDHRHRAIPGRIQPLSLRLTGTSGYPAPHSATFRECLLSSRSRVRVAVGAHRCNPRSPGVLPRIGHIVMMPSGVAVPAACPMAPSLTGPAAPPLAWSARPRWPAVARYCRAGTPSQRARSSGPCGPSARGGWRPRPRRACSRCRADRESGSAGPGRLQGTYPEPAAEVGMPERPAAWAGEHKPVITRTGVSHDVRGQVRRDQLRYRQIRDFTANALPPHAAREAR